MHDPTRRRTACAQAMRLSKLRIAALAAATLACAGAHADESGVPFWLSGQYAAMAALPPNPGWTTTLLPYYYSGSAGASKTFERGGSLVADLDSQAPLVIAQLGYSPETRVLGAQLMVGLGWGVGSNSTTASLSASAPAGSGQKDFSDSKTGGTDLYPIASLYWSKDSDNAMLYLTGSLPVGAYNAQRLSNIGIGHAAIDAGGGYTYLNTKSGFEASAVVGFTYNWKNPDTNYRNGVDSHLDWSVSQFLSESWQLGLAGYVYEQLTNDTYPTSGVAGQLRQQVLGGFRSRVAAVGPQLGYVFKFGKESGYLNVRGYREFAAQNRLEGYALFGTINLPFGQ